jgi:hypothetical protein
MRRYPNISLPVGDVDKQVAKVARAARWATLDHAGLRGEGWIPVPLPPPAWPKPCILRVNLSAIKPSNSNGFSCALQTPNRQSRFIILQKAHFSLKLWTPQIRYGSRNSNVSKVLQISTKRGFAAPLGQARASVSNSPHQSWNPPAPASQSGVHK